MTTDNAPFFEEHDEFRDKISTVDDTGKLSIKPADLGLPAGETCEVEIILRRARDGQLETALSGHGGITAKQIRSVKVTVGP